MTPKTPNDGARTTRKQIVAKARRLKTSAKAEQYSAEHYLDMLIGWVLDMDRRANRKAGGLGRR